MKIETKPKAENDSMQGDDLWINGQKLGKTHVYGEDSLHHVVIMRDAMRSPLLQGFGNTLEDAVQNAFTRSIAEAQAKIREAKEVATLLGVSALFEEELFNG